MQRIVRRSELESEQTSPSDVESEQDFAQAFKHVDQLKFVHTDPEPETRQDKAVVEDEVDFRLFAASKSSVAGTEASAPQKVRLRSPSVEYSTPGFLRKERDPSYYFQNAQSHTEKKNMMSSALSGEQIFELSKSYRPGNAYNWKVLHLPASGLAKSLRQSELATFSKLTDNGGSRERKRPGKKARVKVRLRQEERLKQHLESKATAEAKEAADREKRTLKNREKKVKKRMRDKAKKAEAAQDTTTAAPPPVD